MHKDTILPQISSEQIQTEEKEGVLLVSFKSNSVSGTYSNPDHDGEKMEKCYMKIIDFGGHQVLGVVQNRTDEFFSGVHNLLQIIPP